MLLGTTQLSQVSLWLNCTIWCIAMHCMRGSSLHAETTLRHTFERTHKWNFEHCNSHTISLSLILLSLIHFLSHLLPLFIVSTFSLRAPAITGLMVDGLVKFPDARAARLFGKMVAEEMIPRRLEGGGGHGGDFVLSLIIPHALVLMLMMMMMKQNTVAFQTKR